MSLKVSISLGGDLITVSAFIDAASDLYAILNEIDREVSGSQSVIWSIAALRSTSAVMEAAPILVHEETPDNRDRIVAAFVQGMQKIETQPVRPDYFSNEALIKAKHLVGILNENINRIVIRGTVDGRLSDHIQITQRVAAHVDKLIGVRPVSLGSVEGILELISIHGGTYFNIYDQLTKRRVKCVCDRDILNELTDYRNLGRRLLVYGEIQEDISGQPISIKVGKYRFLRDRQELPQGEHLRGILANLPGAESN